MTLPARTGGLSRLVPVVVVLTSALMQACTQYVIVPRPSGLVPPPTDVLLPPTVPPDDLIPRILPPKTYAAVPDNVRFSATQIVVKFVEGSGARHTAEAGFYSSPSAVSARSLSAKAGLSAAQVDEEVSKVNRLVSQAHGATIRPIFDKLSPESLVQQKLDGEIMAKRELPDLSLYFNIVLPEPNPNLMRSIIAALIGIPIVEQAYAQPIPRNASDIPPPTTINLTAMQGYLSAASSGGIDVAFARIFPGGLGNNTRIVDVEFGWNFDHEDLPNAGAAFSWHGINFPNNHGTAVAGMLWGVENSYGVTGIVPQAGMGWSSVVGASPFFPAIIYSPAAAIMNAAADLLPGEIILIEQHLPDFRLPSCSPGSCSGDQCGYLPVEFYGAEFAAISTVAARGIVVVEAAGNGSMNLDGPAFGGLFNRLVRDSGAILVGASNGSGNLSPSCFTNSGSRLDVHAWGGGIATTAYGNAAADESAPPEPAFAANGADTRQWYTAGFGGTSGASPMVAGAAGLIQSIRTAKGFGKLTPRAMRTLLSTTGTPQGPGVPIGPQPDLRAALAASLPDSATGISLGLASSVRPAQAVQAVGKFKNTGPLVWGATHKVACNWIPQTGSAISVPTSLSGTGPESTVEIRANGVAPNTLGPTSMHCDLLASGRVLAAIETGTIVESRNEFGGAVLSIDLPSTMPFGLNGNAAKPQEIPLVVKNTGTSAWAGETLNSLRLGVFTSQEGEFDVPIVRTVAPGETVTVHIMLTCDAPGVLSVTVGVRMAGVPIGSRASGQTRCLGVIHNPPPD